MVGYEKNVPHPVWRIVDVIHDQQFGTMALDCDVRKNGYGAQENLGLMNFKTTTVLAGGGVHKYYQFDGRWYNWLAFCESLDFRTKGGQIILPPIVHENGSTY
jgi:hypothetical protein